MPLPDKISAAEMANACKKYYEQPGGSTYSNGPLPPGPTGTDLPGSAAQRSRNAAAYGPASPYESPTNMVGDDDQPKLSTHSDEEER